MSNSNRPIQQKLEMFSKYKTCKMLKESHPKETIYGKKKIVFLEICKKKANWHHHFRLSPLTGNDNHNRKSAPLLNHAPKSKKPDLSFLNKLYLAMNLSSSLLAKKKSFSLIGKSMSIWQMIQMVN